MKRKLLAFIILISISSSQGLAAGMNFFNFFKGDRAKKSSSNQVDPNCPDAQWQKYLDANKHIQGIQRHMAFAASDPSIAALENKAIAQVSCPTIDLVPGDKILAGVCALNNYRGSTYDCAYYVRHALRGTVLPPGGGLGDAKEMGSNLRAGGMQNLCNNGDGPGSTTCQIDPYSVPNGSVLIYDNIPGHGCHPAGHAEIKTSRGFVSDYLSPMPRNEGSACRRLIGVWVKGR